MLFSDPFFRYPIIIGFISIIVFILAFLYENKRYKESDYYLITKTPYILLRFNKGSLGEYMTYKYLRKFEDTGAKFLFNLYIPKTSGETTEIDLIMISQNGLFVFESKNYSGWIFGNERNKNWCQVLPTGRGRSRKEQFYNPIMQNRSHISNLKKLIGEQYPVFSVIVFSERCTLKKIELQSDDIRVIKRDSVLSAVTDICQSAPAQLSDVDIAMIYEKLYPCTQASEQEKAAHVEAIQIKKNPQPEHSCPRCGGTFVLRHSKSGTDFWGCSNFPRCRYTKPLEHSRL